MKHSYAEDIFSDSVFIKKLLRISLPIALQALMLALVAAADAFMLGRIEQNAMSAVSLATQIQFIQNMMVGSVVGTASILGAQYWGKCDTKTLDFIITLSLKLSGAVSLLFFLASEFIPSYLMMIFTNEEELIQIGAKYLRIAGWSYLLTGISQIYLVTMKITDHTGMTAVISVFTVCLNIILNAVFIFGAFGLPRMEAEGAALATVISRIVELLWSVIISFRKDYFSIKIKNFFNRNKDVTLDFFKCMLPILGACIFWGVGFTSYSAFMGHMGQDAAAANSVVSVIRDLVCCLSAGLATGAGIVVGNELGAGNLEKGKLYGDRMILISFLCGFASTLLMLLSTPLIKNFVRLTPEAEKLLTGMMLIMAFYMIGRSVNSILINGVFGSGGDTLFDMYSLAVCMWLIAIPLAFSGTFIFHWHPLVVLACTCLDEVGKIPWVLIHFKKYKWVKDLTR